jgi:hypothetical protein
MISSIPDGDAATNGEGDRVRAATQIKSAMKDLKKSDIRRRNLVAAAFAIKRFFNCMTDDANKNGQLTINEVNLCYDKEYHSGPFATHSHSANN